MVSTKIEFSRTQWASGQGFFHSGRVTIAGASFLYVYDCGSFDLSAMSREIDAFLNRYHAPIDVLFVSHFHYDHVSGLPYLLRAGVVRSLVLPLIPESDKVIALCHALASGVTPEAWYLRFLANPRLGIQELDPECEIYELQPQLPSDDPDDDDDASDVEDAHVDSDNLVYGDLLDAPPEGRSREEVHEAPRFDRGESPSVVASSQAGAEVPVWIFKPLLTSFAAKRTETFLSCLAKTLGVTPKKLSRMLASSSELEELVATRADDMIDAYLAVFPDLNLTSMLLYSGPSTHFSSQGVNYRSRSTVERGEVNAWSMRPAWLGTGDQKIGSRRSTEVAKFYGQLLGRVGTLALPHHGSSGSFHPRLMRYLDMSRIVSVVSVGATNGYGHPHSEVMRHVSSAGSHIVIVTDDEASRWTEAAVCYL
ncbi:hypothetical protein C5C03_09695 [Clavibacter michiganensis]|nr:hypothetical protein C5C03_09695 [Clavibacter michiganensis]PPF94902.1 hypothetical protein C5C05_09995 [Clavibacter michiganensis]